MKPMLETTVLEQFFNKEAQTLLLPLSTPTSSPISPEIREWGKHLQQHLHSWFRGVLT